MNGPIFLIGLPGCGKTTVGKILADALGWAFRDSDLAVLKLVQADQPEISELLDMYAAIGNGQFREYEYTALAELSFQPRAVIATGGGFVTLPKSFDLIKTAVQVVFLDCPITELAKRISGMPQRPMFRGAAIIDKLATLERERKPRYQKLAKFTVDATREPAAVAREINGLLENKGAGQSHER